jgi:hypothetical protein
VTDSRELIVIFRWSGGGAFTLAVPLSKTTTLSRIICEVFGNRIETCRGCDFRLSVAATQVERVVLNALAKRAALPPDICAFGDSFPIDFGEVDPPLAHVRT